jgi:hypothetical protein
MSWKKNIIFMFIFMGISGMSLFCQEPSGRFDFINAEALKKNINLTDDQVRKIDAIVNELFKITGQKRIDLARCELDIKEQLMKDSQDISRIKILLDKKYSVLNEIELTEIKSEVGIKSLLTADQLSKYNRSKNIRPQFQPTEDDRPPFMNDEKKEPGKEKK